MTKHLLTLVTATALSSLSPVLAGIVTCYSDPGQLTPHSQSTYQSLSLCEETCTKANRTVSAVHNSNACYCGTESQLPDPDAEVSCSDYSVPCPGWPMEDCGGPTIWSITTPPPASHNTNRNKNKNKRIDPSTESVIVTAPDTDDQGKPQHPDALDSLSVNPTVVQTGVELQLPTSSAGAIDGFKTAPAPIPSSILTAPGESGETETGPIPTGTATGKGTAATGSMGASPSIATATVSTTMRSGGSATAIATAGSGSGSGGSETGTTAGASGTSSSEDGGAAGVVVPSGIMMMMLMSGLVVLFC